MATVLPAGPTSAASGAAPGPQATGAESEVPAELVSYRTLRVVVGVLGMAMPIVLLVWGLLLRSPGRLLDAISDYYAYRTRDVFVGVLFTIAWFLFTYRGYDARDRRAGNLACLFALGVALFPDNGTALEQRVHALSAAALFLDLAYFSALLFTRSGGNPTPQKLKRNRIYRACGWAIVACIAAIALYFATGRPEALRPLRPVFWLETLALWAFGFSWFVKGETVWRDPPARPPSGQAA